MLRCLVLLVALGALVGVPRSVSARETLDRVVAVVNDEIVLASELDRETERSVAWQEASSQLTNATPAQIEAKRQEIEIAVLNGVIDSLLVRKEAERYQLQARDEDVQRYLAELAAQNGFSSVAELKEQVEESGAYGTWADYQEEIRQQLLIYTTVQMLAAPTVTEAQVRAYYRTMTKDEGASVDVDRFVVTPSGSDSKARDEAFSQAQAVATRLREGTASDILAKELGHEAEVRVTITRGSVVPALEDAIFAAKAGQVVGPLDAGQGYVVARVVEHHASAALKYEEAKPRIQEHLRMEASIKAEREFKESLRAKAHVDIRL